MSEIDLAWASGLFEGEGCFSYHRKAGGDVQTQAIMTSTDLDVLERFQEVVGMGKIRSKNPKVHELGKKNAWAWQVTSEMEFRKLGLMLWAHLGKRRKARFMEILDILDNRVDGRTTRYQPA